jgi:hypothetical protein
MFRVNLFSIALAWKFSRPLQTLVGTKITALAGASLKKLLLGAHDWRNGESCPAPSKVFKGGKHARKSSYFFDVGAGALS